MTSPSQNQVSQFKIREGTGIVVMSRVRDWQEVLVLKASISSIHYYVYTLDTSLGQPTQKATGSVTVSSSTWIDGLSTLGWTVDSLGYNAAIPIPASAFTNLLADVRGNRFQVEIIGSPFSGDDFWIADLTIDTIDGLSRGT